MQIIIDVLFEKKKLDCMFKHMYAYFNMHTEKKDKSRNKTTHQTRFDSSCVGGYSGGWLIMTKSERILTRFLVAVFGHKERGDLMGGLQLRGSFLNESFQLRLGNPQLHPHRSSFILFLLRRRPSS